MSAKAFLGSSVVTEQLLAGENPRCFWTTQGRRANPAFERYFPADYAPAPDSDWQDVFGFRCSFTPLVIDGTRGIFIDAVPLSGAKPDQRFSKLPSILRRLTQTEYTAHQVRALMDELLDADPRLFVSVSLLRSRGGWPFVLVREKGEAGEARSAWRKWPLERLFTTRRPCVITSPGASGRGLAIPFAVESDRYVVIAKLRGGALDDAESLFLRMLEELTLPGLVRRPSALDSSLDKRTAEEPLSAPRLVTLGLTDELRATAAELAVARGYALSSVPSFGHLLQCVERAGADAILLDARALSDPLVTLRLLRHAPLNSDLPILYFDTSAPTAEIGSLVDVCVGPAFTRDALFKGMKQIVSLIPARRKQALRGSVASFEATLRACTDHAHLARSIASAAVLIAGDWAAVSLLDGAENVHLGEYPLYGVPVMSCVPSTLLSGYSIMRSPVDQEFYREILDDEATIERLRNMRPSAAASIPLVHSGRVSGTLLILSQTHAMRDAEWDALLELSAYAARALEQMNGRLERATEHRTVETAWSGIELQNVRIDTYAGTRATMHARTLAVDEGRAAIVLMNDPVVAESAVREFATALRSGADASDAVEIVAACYRWRSDSMLAAVFEAPGHLTFSALRIPPPLQVSAHATSVVTSAPVGHRHGTLELRENAVTMFFSSDFLGSFNGGEAFAVLQSELQAGIFMPVRILPAFADEAEKIAFVAITRPPCAPG